MDNNTKVRNWQLNSLRSERRLSWNSWERGGPESEYQDRYHHGDRGYIDHTRYGGYSRERHDRGGYESRHHDDGLDIERRREKVPKFHGEPHSRRVRDHNRNKVYEWLMEEEVSSEAKEECKPIGVLPTLSPNLSPMEYKGPSTDTFHMTCKVEAKTCLVMIDGGSGTNMVSERLVAKLSLRVVKHPNPFELQWLGEVGDWLVRTQAMVPLRIGDIESSVLCDVVPMNICHVLLGKPWECDNKAIKNDITKEYTCVFGKKRTRLRHLLPHDVDIAYEHLRNERERDKRLESASEPKKSSECGGGERNTEKTREESCKPRLLTFESNHGWALNNLIPIALGEKDKPHIINTYELPFCFDACVAHKIGGLEGGLRVKKAPSNFLPVMSSCEQCQVEPLLAQGSSILTLTCDNDSMKRVNVIGLQMPICVDRLITCDLFDMWHYNLESLFAKFNLTYYDDPFLRYPHCDKHVMPRVDTYLNVGMIPLYARMTKHNFFVDRRIIANICKIVFEFVCWHDKLFYCMTIKPFNGVGMFYGSFVKDLTTNDFVLDYLVKEFLDVCTSISYVYILDFLEYDHGKYLDGIHICVRRKIVNRTIAYNVEFACVLWFGCNFYAPYLIQALLFNPKFLIPSGRIFPTLLLLYDYDDGIIDGAIYSLDILHVEMCKLDYVVLNTLGKPSPPSRTMIFDLDSLDFVGMLDRDLRTNPSKEGGNDVNPGVLKKNQRTGFEDKSFQKEGEDDVNPGSAKPIEGVKAYNEPNRSWGLFQMEIGLSRWCPNALLRLALSSSSKELHVSTLHASIGARMRKLWSFYESRAVTPEEAPDPGEMRCRKRPVGRYVLFWRFPPENSPGPGEMRRGKCPVGRFVRDMRFLNKTCFILLHFNS